MKSLYHGEYNFRREVHNLYRWAKNPDVAHRLFITELSRKLRRSHSPISSYFDGSKDNFRITKVQPKSKIAKAEEDEGPQLRNFFIHLYLTDANRLLEKKYSGNLPKPVKRKLLRQSIVLMKQFNGRLDELKKELKAKKITGTDPLIKQAKKVKIASIKDIPKKWNQKIEPLDKILYKRKGALRKIIGKKTSTILSRYIGQGKREETAAELISKAPKLTKITEYVYVSKWNLRAIAKGNPKLIKKLGKSTNVTDKDRTFIGDITTKKKKDKKKKKEKTQKTHPGFFTSGKNPKLLSIPIKEGSTKVEYNDSWKSKSDNTWYAKSVDPDSGAGKYHYTKDFMKKNQDVKWDGVRKLQPKLKSIRKKIEKDLTSRDKRRRLMAIITYLADQGPFRIGNIRSEKDGVLGLHTLKVGNVKFKKGNKVIFSYTGKGLREEKIAIKIDSRVYKALKKMIKEKGKKEYVFTWKGRKIGPNNLNNYFQTDLGSPASIHKLRDVMATELMEKELKKLRVPKKINKREFKKLIKEAARKVSQKMHHDSVNTTLKSYIDPKLIERFKKKHKVKASFLEVKADMKNISLINDLKSRGGGEMKVLTRILSELEELGEHNMADMVIDREVLKMAEAAKKSSSGLPLKYTIKMSDVKAITNKKIGKSLKSSQAKGVKSLSKIFKGIKADDLIKEVKAKSMASWDQKGKKNLFADTLIILTLAGEHLGKKEVNRKVEADGFKKTKEGMQKKLGKDLVIDYIPEGSVDGLKGTIFRVRQIVPIGTIAPIFDPIDPKRNENLFQNTTTKTISRILKDSLEDQVKGLVD